MKMFIGKRSGNFEEAARVCYREADVSDMSVSVAKLFAPVIDESKLHSEAEKGIASKIKSGYGKNATWSGKSWYVPVPTLGYDTRDIPHILVEVRTDLVAVERVRTRDDAHDVTLVGTVGKPRALVLPIIFLRAILDDDLERFAVVARGGNRTTWNIPGTKPLELPDEFINRLSRTLRRNSVATWLRSFGSQGRSVAPLAVGSLLGLQYMDARKTVPTNKQQWTYDGLLSTLQGMAYPPEEAKEALRRVSPYLRADHTVDDAVRIIMQTINEGR